MKHTLQRRPAPSHLAMALATLGLLGGCAVTPKSLSQEEVLNRVQADRLAMYAGQEAISAPISLDEAVARALKYNLDYRLKIMESALGADLAQVANYEMLPNLLLSAGYVARNNDSGGNSVNIDTGQVSLANSTSQERNRKIAGAEFSWNVLDLGVSYFRARQQADQYLVAEERRRRVIQNILQDVRASYWRAVGAQRLAREADALRSRAKQALARSRAAEAQGLLPPKDALAYQRLLLDAMSLLSTRRQELEFAKKELAALMSVPPGTEFSVAEADEPALAPVPDNIMALEEIALAKRPELREEDYRVRITADEARRQLTSLLPGINLSAGAQYDSNTYLYNNNWVDTGVRVNFNLLRALSLPAMKNAQQAQAKVDEARRLALSMAIMTQVRIAVERYRLAMNDLEIARDSSVVDQRLASYAKAALETRADNELELIRAETRALNAEYQRYAAYSSAQTAFGRIYNSLGLDVVPENISDAPVPVLATTIGQHIADVEKVHFPQLAAQPARLTALKLAISLPQGKSASASDAPQIRSAVERVLKRNLLTLLPNGTSGPQLDMRLSEDPVKGGVRRAYWTLSLKRADGTPAGSTRYASTLPEGSSQRALTAFAEAAAVANLNNFNLWLNK